MRKGNTESRFAPEGASRKQTNQMSAMSQSDADATRGNEARVRAAIVRAVYGIA